jgi:hypothetical protein
MEALDSLLLSKQVFWVDPIFPRISYGELENILLKWENVPKSCHTIDVDNFY